MLKDDIEKKNLKIFFNKNSMLNNEIYIKKLKKKWFGLTLFFNNYMKKVIKNSTPNIVVTFPLS
jgi:hypothetical protein